MEALPRRTVDWDTSQADDFRDGGVSWTSRGLPRGGRAARSDRKSLAQRRPAGRQTEDRGADHRILHPSQESKECCSPAAAGRFTSG